MPVQCPGCRILKSFGYCCPNQQIDLQKLMTSSNVLTNSGCEGQFVDLDNSIQRLEDPAAWTGILRGML